MRLQNIPGHGVTAALLGGEDALRTGDAIHQKNTVVMESNHRETSSLRRKPDFFAHQYSINLGECKAILQEKSL